MQIKQIKHTPLLFKVLLISCCLWIIAVSGFVYANRYDYIYPSDVMNENSKNNNKNNSDIDEQDIWRYQFEIPKKFQNSHNPYLMQYQYPPPIQKPGSNPFFK